MVFPRKLLDAVSRDQWAGMPGLLSDVPQAGRRVQPRGERLLGGAALLLQSVWRRSAPPPAVEIHAVAAASAISVVQDVLTALGLFQQEFAISLCRLQLLFPQPFRLFERLF